MSLVSPLPPVKECSLQCQEIAAVQVLLNQLLGVGEYTPLVLYKRARALQVGDLVIGSHGPRYSKSSIVLQRD